MQEITTDGDGADDVKGKGKQDKQDDGGPVLRHTLRWGLERADVELVSWLCGLDGRWASRHVLRAGSVAIDADLNNSATHSTVKQASSRMRKGGEW